MTKQQLIEKCTQRAEFLQNLLKQYKKETGEYFKVEVYDDDEDYDEEDDEGRLWWYLKPTRMKFTYAPTYTKEDLEGVLEEIEGYISEIKTLYSWLPNSDGKPKPTKKVTRNTDQYAPINKGHVKQIQAASDIISQIQKESGHTEIQWSRHFMDLMTGYEVGCQIINEGLAGWDGKYNDDVLFEAKNNTLNKKGNLDANFDNIPDQKIQEMKAGALGVVTAWETFGKAAFRVVFNTKNIADTVERTLGKKRRSTTVSFNQLFESGAKVVACEFSRKETLNNIRKSYPYVKITMDDIYDKRSLKKIAREFAEM